MDKTLPIRFIHVTGIERITPRMARATFGGDDLADFACDGPDQQVKLYFPKPGQTQPRLPEAAPDGDVMRWYQSFVAMPEDERPWMRSFTLRSHRPEQQEIDIDFVLHDDGPASRWARSAAIGDTLGMFGPSVDYARSIPLGTSITSSEWFMAAGDETALPAIGTILESLPDGTRADVYIEVADAQEEQPLAVGRDVAVHWLHRSGRPTGVLLVDAVRAACFPPGPVFAWLAGEAGTVRALRRHLVEDRGIHKSSIDFTGYWRLRLTQDDAPTVDDLTDAQERLAGSVTH